MRVLITGGSGFIGWRVARTLLARGIPVLVADWNIDPGIRWHLQRQSDDLLEFVSCDVSEFHDIASVFHRFPGITHVIHLAYLMSAGFDALKIRNISLEIVASERKRLLQIDQITASHKDVHPGQPVDLTVTFTEENGVEAEKTVRYIVPVGAPYGTLNFTVSDANYSNLLDYQQLASTVLKSPTQVISFLNELRPNTNAYVRVWRTDPAYQVQGEDMPDPPPSLGLILAKAQAAQGAWFARGSKIDELLIETGNVVVTGSKNVSVEVKE